MTIILEFSIGDTVWWMYNNKVQCGTLDEVEIIASSTGIKYTYSVLGKDGLFHIINGDEDVCFYATKEALLASL